ncbi:MAG: dihydroorotase [Candidatus Omnitrophota bacterium]
MSTILIQGGRVIDPANKRDEVSDVLVKDGRIAEIARDIKPEGAQVIAAAGNVVMPGIVDMHVHLRQPGREDKETVASGSRAGLRGGVTTMLAMPNTLETIDCIATVRKLRDIISRTACAHVLMCGAITKERAGKELSDIAGLAHEGIVAISDDGASVDSEELLREALVRAHKAKVTVTCHCEDKTVSTNGVVNLGFTSTRLGLRGISKEAEWQRVARDIECAAKQNVPIHIAHVSCKESLEIIAKAKQKGVRVSAETAPHYFSLNEEAVLGYDTNFKMNPPLRSASDVIAIKEALRDGIIDVIASDHAPHTENEKEIEFDRAEFGVIGLETELAVSYTHLVVSGVLGVAQLVEKFTVAPARILGINKGTLGIGADADLVVFNPQRAWVVKKEELVSKSKNSPYLGKTLRGVVECTIYNGSIVYVNTPSI